MIFVLSGCLNYSNQSTEEDDNNNVDWYQPPVSATWQWQLQGAVDTSYDVDIYDIDLFDSSKSLIHKLQISGKKVICYFSAGSFEKWRADAQQFVKSDLGKKLDGWANERWLNIRSTRVRSIIKKRLLLAKQKGCDGVEPDNLDAYMNHSGFHLSAVDQLDFNRFIANEAHNKGLSVGLKNDLDQIPDLIDYFDFIVNEQCFEYGECDSLKVFIANGKAVLNAEYKPSYLTSKASRKALCTASLRMKFSTLVLSPALNNSLRFSCSSELKW